VLVTACGAKKGKGKSRAFLLYKSSRIRALKKIAGDVPYAILSAKYGLVDSEEILEPYEKVMTEAIAKKHVSRVGRVLKNYDVVVYYRGGARKTYLECLVHACRDAMVPLIVCGYANMGDIGNVSDILAISSTGSFSTLEKLPRVSVIAPSNP
jgi:hypothetical protein